MSKLSLRAGGVSFLLGVVLIACTSEEVNPSAGSSAILNRPLRGVEVSLDEARAKAPFPVLLATYVPGGGKHERTLISAESDPNFAVVLEYTGPIWVQLKEIDVPPDWGNPRFAAEAKEMTVRGGKAAVLLDPSAASTGGRRILHWLESADVQVTMMDPGGKFSNEELLRMAESMRV